jgi:hypothetical protein
MKTLRLFAYLFVVALVACNHRHCGFESVVLASCGVVVQMPGNMQHAASVAKAADVAINVTHHTARFGESVYAVSCNDLAGTMASSFDADDALHAAVQDTMVSTGATLDSQMLIELDGHPGRNFEGSATMDGQPVFVRARAYVAGNHLIQTSVQGVRGQASAADVVRYLDSLKFLENKIQD